jgi:phosphoribosylformimino-5-aminoimidazole carboxamide ribotide isomerase
VVAVSAGGASLAFQVYPAIDVRGGRVVRLAQGDYARETNHADDPLALAQAWSDAGAEWLHLVDLDAARTGGYALQPLLASIKARTGLRVQTGGGVRAPNDIDALLAAGADRVVVGSLAVESPDRLAAWLRDNDSERMVVALDVRRDDRDDWLPATHGWTKRGSDRLDALAKFYAGAGLRHLLCTDIARDGMLSGPNLSLYASLRQWAPRLALQASGGARSLDDVRDARTAGCAGIVLGRALLEGRLPLAEALAC